MTGTPAGPASLDEARSELKSRCDAIESAYEFLLAYAAQGLTSDQANSQVREGNTYGVLKLTLHATSYDWQFVPVVGATLTDSGTGSCH